MPVPPYPTLPNPRTWGASGPEPVLVSELRSDIGNAVTLLQNPPMVVLGQNGAGQNILNTTETPVSMGNELCDPWGIHPTTLAQVTPTLAGWYLVSSAVPTTYITATGIQVAGVGAVQGGGALTYFDGGKTGMEAGTGKLAHPTASKLVQITNVGTDYFHASTYQSSGSTQQLAVTGSKYATLHAQWIAANSGTTGLPVPNPAAWPVSPSYVTSSFLNSNVRDVINFLLYPPIVEVSANSSQSIASGSIPSVGTAVTILGTELVDNYNAFASNKFTAPVAGLYLVYGQVAYTETGITTGNSRGAGLTVTSSNYNSGSAVTLWGSSESPCTDSTTATNLGHTAVVRRYLRLNAGDTVQLATYSNDTGGSRTIGTSGNSTCRFIAVWRGR